MLSTLVLVSAFSLSIVPFAEAKISSLGTGVSCATSGCHVINTSSAVDQVAVKAGAASWATYSNNLAPAAITNVPAGSTIELEWVWTSLNDKRGNTGAAIAVPTSWSLSPTTAAAAGGLSLWHATYQSTTWYGSATPTVLTADTPATHIAFASDYTTTPINALDNSGLAVDDPGPDNVAAQMGAKVRVLIPAGAATNTYTIMVHGVGHVSNTKQAKITTITLAVVAAADTTAPVVTSITPSNVDYSGTYVDASFDLSANITEANTLSTCAYQVNGGAWTGGVVGGSAPNWTCTVSGGLGPYANATALVLNFRGTDNGGNTGTGTAINRTVDALAPTTTDNAPAGWQTADVTVTLTPTTSGSGVATTKYCVDAINSCTPIIVGTLVNVTQAAGTSGTQYVRYFSTDNVGNVEGLKISSAIQIDKKIPAVSSTVPTNGATGVALNGFVTINWDDTVNCATVNTANITSDSPGWSLNNCTGSQALFNTSGQAGGVTYSVNVSTAVADAAGNAMIAAYPFSYTTAGGDVTPPTFSSSVPTNGATGVALNGLVTINFSENLNCTTANSTTEITSDSPGWAYNNCSGNQVIFNTSGQAAGSTYNVNVTTAVTDVAGNAMSAAYPFSYTTAGASCTAAPMSISLTPATQFVSPGDSVAYAVTVTNNDSGGGCTPLNLTLAITGNTGVPTDFNVSIPALSGTAISGLAAGASDSSVLLTVTADADGTNGSALTTTVRVSDNATIKASQSDAVISTIQSFNPMIHSSASAGSSYWGGNWGVTNASKYGKFTCATCHAKSTGNIKRVKTVVNSATLDLFPLEADTGTIVFLDARSGIAEFGNDAGGHVTSDKICEACHTQTKYHRYDTTNQVAAGGSLTHANQSDCVACHEHKQGFKAPECSGCHGGGTPGSVARNYWPDDSTLDVFNDAGRHLVHMDLLAQKRFGVSAAALLDQATADADQKTLCAYCHAVNDDDHASGDTAEVFQALVGTVLTDVAKTYWNTADLVPLAAYNSGPDTCSNVDCHNSKTTTATFGWYTAGTATCTLCHTPGGTEVNGGKNPNSGLHTGALTVSGETHDDSFNGGAANCETCHTATPSSSHWDGAFVATNITINGAITFADGTPETCMVGGALSSCHADGGAWARRWSTTAKNSDGTECVNCHGGYTNPASSATFSGITGMSKRHDFNNDADNDLYANHGGGTDSAPCYQCHGYKPGDATYYDLATKHRDGSVQLNNQNTFVDAGALVQCDACHTTPYGTADEEHAFEDTTTRWVRDLTVAGPAGGCNACHGGSVSGNPQYWPDGVGSGYQDSSAGAHDNHVLAIANHLYPAITTLDQLRTDTDTDTKQKAICAFCHPNPGESGHMTNVNGGTYNSPNNQVDVLQSSFLTYDGAVASKVDTTSAAYNYTNANCSNLACHNQVVTPSGGNNWNTPPAASNCSLCHTGAGASQRHDLHVTTKGYACTECHTNVGTYPTGTGAPLRHADGRIQLVWNNAGSFENTNGGGSVTYSQAAPLPYKDATWGTCASAACHNNKLTPAWNTAATNACIVCHTRATTGSNPSSGLHYGSTAPTVSGTWHDDTLTATNKCTVCHSSLTSQSTHVDGTFQGGNGQKTQMGLFASYTQTADNIGSCSGAGVAAGCHSGAGDNGSWARKWNSSIHYATTASLTPCAGCHGGFNNDWTFGTVANTTDGNVEHNRNWDGDGTAGEVIGNHSNNTDKKCNICHVYGDGAYVWGTSHRNNQITMNSTLGYQRTSTTPNYGCTSTCHTSNIDHGLENSNWTLGSLSGPALSCISCHNGTGTGALSVGSGSSHVIRGTKAGFNTFNACEDCHPGGANTHLKNGVASVVAIPNYGTVGISYSHVVTTGVSGFVLGGTATTGTTEAEICWNCHTNTTTYQTTAISEWGANNKQAGTPASVTAYNYGTLNQSSWVGASWSSAQTNYFGYKTGTVRSTHTANPAGAPWNGPSAAGVDTVGQIRCSYCHDVHNTAAGVVTGDVSGKPFLRGTWWTNPYREDGAPRVAGTGTVVSTTWTARDWGAVPRGSNLNNEYGGYQIDQNNGFPTNNGTAPTKSGSTWTWSNSWTYSGSAGLCALCHGSTVNTLNKFGTAGPNAAWIGTNGHANSAVGGTGTSASNIFRTTDRAPSGVNTQGARPDMGYANHGTGVGYGFRGPDGRAFRDVPTMVGVQSGNSTRPYAGTYYSWRAAVDAGTTEIKYHNFSCSKCHNPHASRLPRLMITNCLDTKQNTWDDGKILDVTNSNNNGITMGATAAPDSFNRTWSNTTSAQNCHRLAGTNTAQPAGFGSGWNRVTPWTLGTGNPVNTVP